MFRSYNSDFEGFKEFLFSAGVSVVIVGGLLSLFGISDARNKKAAEKFDEANSYKSENILVVDGLPNGPEIFVYKDFNLTSKEYYSISDEQWYSINPKDGKPGVNTIISNSVFPLEFYLTEEEKEKESFTLEELEVIKQRIEEKDASLGFTRKLI